MSKVMATSGNHASVIKGAAAGGNAAVDGASSGLFAAFFGGMQQAETDTDADSAQALKDTAESEKIIDPHLAALLGAMRRPYPGNDKTDSQTSDELQKDGSDLEKDNLADAGLLAVDSQVSDTGQRRSGQSLQQGLSTMASLAEDLKQAQTNTSAAQRAQTATAQSNTELDEDFIGPPLPQSPQKFALAGFGQSDNNLKKAVKAAHQTARLHSDMPQWNILKTQAQYNGPSADVTEELTDTDILDAAMLKAVRLPEATTRLGDRPAHTVKSSVQLTASADAQTGFSAAGQQANSGQPGGQQSGAGSAFTGTAPTDLAEQWIDILDMQDEKWTDQLARRIDRELKTGGKGLELEMNPRNLGRLKVSLSVTQDQTNVVLRTETGAAAQMLSEAEGRLVQMLGEAGLKLGQFEAFSGGQNRGFGQHNSEQEQNGTVAEAENDGQTADTAISDGLVNLKA